MLSTLIEITRAGGDLALEMRKQPQAIMPKDTSSWNYATQVDVKVEQLIINHLRKEFPDIPIVAEEQGEHTIPGERFFTVDPLDGTIPYSNGFPNWGVIIGYIDGGEPTIGAMYLPQEGLVIYAAKGQGCYVNDIPVILDYPRPLAHTVVSAELGPWVPSEGWAAMSVLRTKCRWLGGSGFAAASIADVLLGKAGAYLNFNARIWDFSAGALAISEAGGFVSHPDGTSLVWNQIDMRALFAANKELAREILEITI